MMRKSFSSTSAPVTVWILLFLVLLHTTCSQIDVCTTKETCGECIRSPSCSWCLQEGFSGGHRCKLKTNFGDECPPMYTYAPLSEHTTSSYSPTSKSSILSPPKIKLKLRVGDKYRVNITYVQPGNYPVDLYYLMDLSNSMKDDKETLSGMGVALHKAMAKMTNDFRLGFGTFVDKVLMPYVETSPQKLKVPCTDCTAPYGFRNHMKLDSSTELFSRMVNESRISGNLDPPEGGLDAIVQCLVCGDQIGWRNRSRRLLLFSTDASFHYAGDGKFGGVIKPNDGLCHLDDLGFYTESSYQDYPSIAQINRLAQKHSVNIIFAVTEDQKGLYNSLSSMIKGSVQATLKNDSSNVVKLISDQYAKIRSQVDMKDDAPSYMSVKYYSTCLGDKHEPKNKCDGLKMHENVTFEVEFSVTSCPDNPLDWQKTVTIFPVGLVESMMVDVSTLCNCDCEKEIGTTGECGNGGKSKCGICYCDEEHIGMNCECLKNNTDHDQNTQQCSEQNSIVCSGRGHCECGKCQCDKDENSDDRYSGRFCDCDNYSCKRTNGSLCSGNGFCGCDGRCICTDQDYEGDSCDCPKSQEMCQKTIGEPVCSGKGNCVCGKCECSQTNEGHYWGTFCEQCPTCPDHCNKYKDCVLCLAYQKGTLGESCNGNCSHINVTLSTERPVANEQIHQQNCTYYFNNSCKYHFVYSNGYLNEIVDVVAQMNMECSEPIHIVLSVISAILAIVLIGIVGLLLWKLVTCLHDRFEYARFEEERVVAMWEDSDNPIFKQPTTTFNNPTYTG